MHNRKEPSARITTMVTGSFGSGMRKGILNQVLGINDTSRRVNLNTDFRKTGNAARKNTFR